MTSRASNHDLPPDDLRGEFLEEWRVAVAALRELGAWSHSARPLLIEVVRSAQLAAEHRELARENPVTVSPAGRAYVHPSLGVADREMRRALLYANALGLPFAARARLGLKATSERAPSVADELAARKLRRRAGGAA